jgi:two-component system, chemotaxis family, protein-glutamate methylesterase/glutaminase
MARIVVIGASLGGVSALQQIAAALPKDFAAPVLMVLHVGQQPSTLPAILASTAALEVAHATDGEPLSRGRILIAPPDHHMFAIDGRIVLTRGPKEHHTRPAIDPLFRSAALAYGPNAVGVVLTGQLDDGTAGLQAIKSAGGLAVVQDPIDAVASSMPLSALRYVDVDHCVSLPFIPALLTTLAAVPPRAPVARPDKRIGSEQELTLQKGDPIEHMEAIGRPSTFACPDCHGTLWEVLDARPQRYRCHTGHGFTARTLQDAMQLAGDEALWNVRRALQERQILLRKMAARHRDTGEITAAGQLEFAAAKLDRQGELLLAMLGKGPEPVE